MTFLEKSRRFLDSQSAVKTTKKETVSSNTANTSQKKDPAHKAMTIWIIVTLIMLVLMIFAVPLTKKMFGKFGKPAIYLYPTEDSYIDVRLDINGRITVSNPDYGDGWQVFVTKDGLIEGKYDYLAYEAVVNKNTLPDKGWIVSYIELESWLDQNLIMLGLTEREKDQFKEYWLPRLAYSDYYQIKLYDPVFLEENLELIIDPKPDNVIRLNLNFKPLDKFVEINQPVISTPERTGFTVVEWGGVISS